VAAHGKRRIAPVGLSEIQQTLSRSVREEGNRSSSGSASSSAFLEEDDAEGRDQDAKVEKETFPGLASSLRTRVLLQVVTERHYL
jgi:hypothetical protein